MGRARDYNYSDKVGAGNGQDVNYYAHTAVRMDGKPDRDQANWQLLSTHLHSVGL